MTTSYVKFLRGTISDFNQLKKKDLDTLYFIYEDINSDKGLLYLGDKLVSGNLIKLKDLEDIDFDNVETSSFLIYNPILNKWEAKSIHETTFHLTWEDF